MRWYRIIENGETVTAVQYDSPVWVCMSNGTLLRCLEGQAQGILHSDGNEVFLLQGKAPITGRQINKVAVEITMSEYEQIINEDYGDDDIPDPDPGDEPEAQMTIAQMRARIRDLEASVEFLGDCLIEMSEEVYG